MIHWEWDPAKAASNTQKHGVSFELAVLALDDPLRVEHADPHEDGNRCRTVGRPFAGQSLLLIVIHTEPIWLDGEWVGRIISARPADRRERQRHEEGQI